MQTVVETPTFYRQAESLFSDEEREAVIEFLAASPHAGDLIPGTGGVRKIRVPARGKGKRGGARVIYYVVDEDAPIYALLVYAKNVRTDMTMEQKKAVAALVTEFKVYCRR